ncbi:unnamed protein product [Phytomonas sp. EM1]|nr:unnamed protein product [Phytomonas sp. EM1]|eukprot:CCW64582.1 unnamed protein product [Phytomonas sp. isolate EM1]
MQLPQNRIITVCGVVVVSTVVLGTTVALLYKRKKTAHDVDDDFNAFAVSPLTKSAVDASDADRSKASEKLSQDDVEAAIIEESLDELVPKKFSPIVSQQTTLDPTTSLSNAALSRGDASDKNRKVIEHLGISMRMPGGWEVREELSPVPNIAMLTVFNPEFADAPQSEVPGSVPIMILSVEDIRAENLNLTEFKDRSKSISMYQMHMMTGGAIEPVLRKDAAVGEGPFRHILEYAQNMPPFFDISVVNLIEVRYGIAYVFQIMCSPTVMEQHKSVFMQIARDMELKTLDNCSLGYLKVFTGSISIRIDTMWGWGQPASRTDDNQGVLARFEQLSTVKREEILLYNANCVPEADLKPRKETTVDGVVIQSVFDGMHERKEVRYGDYVLVVKPLQKAISYIPESVLVEAIKSVEASTEKPRPRQGATFYCPEYDYCFDVIGGSRVVSTKLGAGTVVYAPLGVPQDMTKEIVPEEQGPTVTIRVGSPENDPDCMPSIEGWHERIKSESGHENITNIELTTRKGQPCLSFTSKEMQEIGPGQKLEVRGDVFIFVRNGVTTLIRWETATGKWRKYEHDLHAFFESFTFLA